MLGDFKTESAKESPSNEKDRYVISFIIFGFIDILSAVVDTLFYIGSVIVLVVIYRWSRITN